MALGAALVASKSKFRFGKKSRFNLHQPVDNVYVRLELIELCYAVLKRSDRDFMVVDGVRTIEEQRRNFQKGFSKTMKSKHLEGRAIDFAPVIKAGVPNWVDLQGFKTIGALFKRTAKEMNLNITWGGDWKTFKDWGHVQLNR